jgi:ribose transport system substrate-binding protein
VKYVGFDAEAALVDGLKAGKIDGLIVQNPSKMGYEGVKAVVEKIKGKTPPKKIDTGVKLVTKENMSDPEIQQLLKTQ